jgi:predicted RNA-binding Zn-ribbon protein involved in translation (DUF1610 family)
MIKIRIKPIKRIKIHRDLKMPIIAILGFILIISVYMAYAAYQQPITAEKTVTTCNYNHYGNFNYIAYLKNNSVYDTPQLLPGQGNIFKKITDHINASFTYTFYCDQPVTIQEGSYTIVPYIQTDIWDKKCDDIIQTTSFSSNRFAIHFPINYTYFESIVAQIDNETGVNAGDPTLILKCNVLLTAETTNGSIDESFSPSLSVPLGRNIIEISGNLSRSKSGVLEETKEIFQPGVIEQGNMWSFTSIIFFIILLLFVVLTTGRDISISEIEGQVKKIKKKYGEWIVETEKLPIIEDAKIVPMKSLDDLVKISEELGKPIIYVASDKDKKHAFYVLDNQMHYQHILSSSEKLKKSTSCPKCGTKITFNGTPGQKTSITCPNCGNKGIITFEETHKRFPFFKK